MWLSSPSYYGSNQACDHICTGREDGLYDPEIITSDSAIAVMLAIFSLPLQSLSFFSLLSLLLPVIPSSLHFSQFGKQTCRQWNDSSLLCRTGGKTGLPAVPSDTGGTVPSLGFQYCISLQHSIVHLYAPFP